MLYVIQTNGHIHRVYDAVSVYYYHDLCTFKFVAICQVMYNIIRCYP